MAHAVQPDHVPHEQLRMEAPKQKFHSDKYVSAFVTGEPTVDMQFRNPVLPKSADHYKVGIDELTVNLGNLSMLEYGTSDVIFRVLRRGDNAGDAGPFLVPDGPPGNIEKWREAFEFKIDRPYLTMLEIMERCREIATAVGTFISHEGLVGGIWTENAIAGQYVAEHFRVSLSANGQMIFSGNRIFWANFAIEVPLEKYRHIIFKDATKQYISLHPLTGQEIPEPYTAVPIVTSSVFANPVWAGGNEVGNAAVIANTTELEYIASGNILNTLDRRVTLEVGCSLPVKNSPLVDHGQEAPDFVLGRYMFHSPYTIQNTAPGPTYVAPTVVVPQVGTTTLQGPRDRVVYHHLQPQQKIQVLRLKLWARVRTYSVVKKTWGMKTIVCPVDSIDYWHVRLHFIEK
jgi:hypothetical protein